MTNQINCQNQQPPAYSGITINITNPTLNPPAQNNYYCTNPDYSNISQIVSSKDVQPQQYAQLLPESRTNTPQQYINKGEYLEPIQSDNDTATNSSLNRSDSVTETTGGNNQNIYNDSRTVNQYITQTTPENNSNGNQTQAYPAEYYLNNYGNIPQAQNTDNLNNPATAIQGGSITSVNGENNNLIPAEPNKISGNENSNGLNEEITDNDNSAQEIIYNIDKMAEEERELARNGKKTRVVSLTNEYIMSLENYLNNPNKEIRLTASKEIIKRLNEDKSRYDDAALNALLNKMLQDPEKLIRIAALSALSSELASGNDYTIQLLTQIQQNPQSDPEDVLDASEILLKRAAMTEIRYVQQPNQPEKPQKYVMKVRKESSEAQ